MRSFWTFEVRPFRLTLQVLYIIAKLKRAAAWARPSGGFATTVGARDVERSGERGGKRGGENRVARWDAGPIVKYI